MDKLANGNLQVSPSSDIRLLDVPELDPLFDYTPPDPFFPSICSSIRKDTAKVFSRKRKTFLPLAFTLPRAWKPMSVN